MDAAQHATVWFDTLLGVVQWVGVIGGWCALAVIAGWVLLRLLDNAGE